MKRNLTVQLDEEVIGRAKVLAAERGTSVSGLVAQQITELAEARDRYAKARDSALRTMADAIDRGGRHWTRAELHDERFDRNGP
ncbi:MAG TPA: DUF6364 family protein [Pseudonocardiaceae bacterium]|jgi:predicted transcriptional regulator|nr:DUF6364 family protein [Pseudonocardiaceae bacterium]